LLMRSEQITNLTEVTIMLHDYFETNRGVKIDQGLNPVSQSTASIVLAI